MNIAIFTGFLFTLVSIWGKPVADNPQPSVQVQLLSQALEDYKKMAASQSWSDLPADICLRPGETNQFMLGLRNHLVLTGDLKSLGTSPVFFFDDSLTLAVKRFQQRHGLQPDGIVGPLTLLALNTTPDERVKQLELNITRWQQIPSDAYPLVLVNIPDFSLQLIDTTQKVVWQTKVIVGQPAKAYQTALINSKISYLVVNPTWNIPKSIIRKEIIPMLKKDPAYLARNYMNLFRVVGSRKILVPAHTVNWNRADPDRNKFMIIQQAGKHNSLGRIKFIFPNSYDQYLHDTPAKSLFSHPVRAYSHGCVRVQHPEILAAYLLSAHWEPPLKLIGLTKFKSVNKIIYLPAPPVIRIGYFTAWVNEKGVLQFRPDIYKLDKKAKKPEPATETGT